MEIYKITNKINNKIYVGMQKYNNPSYLGSGYMITAAVKKYGRENFVKEILQVCSTEKELAAAEIEWIAKLDACNTSVGYNIAKGGRGGALYTKKGKEHCQYGKGYLHAGKRNGMFGRKHTSETLQKIKNHPNVSHPGKLNGNYGKGLPGKLNGLSFPIAAIDFFTNNVIDIFESRTEVLQKMNVTEWSLDKVLKNAKTHYNGIYYQVI